MNLTEGVSESSNQHAIEIYDVAPWRLLVGHVERLEKIRAM